MLKAKDLLQTVVAGLELKHKDLIDQMNKELTQMVERTETMVYVEAELTPTELHEVNYILLYHGYSFTSQFIGYNTETNKDEIEFCLGIAGVSL